MSEQKPRFFRAGGYEAAVLPSAGANVYQLRKDGYDLLRPAASADVVAAMPVIHGLPILFPPNRIAGGRFVHHGRTYQFPVTETATGNSIHGFLYQQDWMLTVIREDDDAAEFRLQWTMDPDSPDFASYPHPFAAWLDYRLSQDGLEQTLTLHNQSDEPMPVGIGWHTAFNLKLTAETDPSAVRVRASIGQRIAQNRQLLPDGRLLELTADEQAFRTDGQQPLYETMDHHYTVNPIELDGQPFHGATLDFPLERQRVIYEVDPRYRHWMIWNCGREGSFICIEPQNWRINAPNLGLPDDESGMDVIAPGDQLNFRAVIRLESI